MSSITRDNPRQRRDSHSCNGIVRRMVSLPRSLLGGFARLRGNGVDSMGRDDRRTQIFPPTPSSPSLFLPPHFQVFPPRYEPEPAMTNDEWAFLNHFEQNYGASHPFFYACRFIQALKIAQDENKFLFVYLHSPDHPFAGEFCRETLRSELVIQFLDANFVSWGALADRGEGLQMCQILRPGSFPFCAVIAPASDDNIAVLQQIEGPVSPAEMVEILQRTLEEQGVAFGSARAKEEEKRRAGRRLREEQDAAYLAALKIDQEKERLKNLPPEQTAQNPVARAEESSHRGYSQWPRHNPSLFKPSQVKQAATKTDQEKDRASKMKNNQVTQILIRFPNGERRECSFCATDKVQAVYKYIDSLGLPGIGKYRLISNFPRKVFGADQMNMTFKDAGLHPKATLFLDTLA